MAGKTSALLQDSGPISPPQNQSPTAAKPLVTPGASKPFEPLVPSIYDKPAPTPNLNPADLKRKTTNLLEEFFSICDLNEALQCVEELKSPGYLAEFVKEAIALAFDKSPPCVEPISNLLEFLFVKKALSFRDLGAGFLHYGAMLDDIALDAPKAQSNLGEVMGRLILAGVLDFKFVCKILLKIEDTFYRKLFFDAALKSIKSNAAGEGILGAQATDFKACERLLA